MKDTLFKCLFCDYHCDCVVYIVAPVGPIGPVGPVTQHVFISITLRGFVQGSQKLL